MSDLVKVGAAANDGGGDTLRAAMQRINQKFLELYTPLTPKPWAAGVAYTAMPTREVVYAQGRAYLVQQDHTSTTVAADLAAGKLLDFDLVQFMYQLLGGGGSGLVGHGTQTTAQALDLLRAAQATLVDFDTRLQSTSPAGGSALVRHGSQTVKVALDTLAELVGKLQSSAPAEGAALVRYGTQTVKAALDTLAAAQSGGIVGYATVADLATPAAVAKPSGTLAIVTSDADPANNTTWRKTGEAGLPGWVASSGDRVAQIDAAYRLADAAILQQVYSLGVSDYSPDLMDGAGHAAAFALTGESGESPFWIDTNGNIIAGKLCIQPPGVSHAWAMGQVGAVPVLGETLDGNLTLGSTALETVDLPGTAFAICDAHGRAALLIQDDGTIVVSKQEGGAVPDPSASTRASLQNQSSDYRHVVVYGQSLARGYEALPVLSSTQPYSNVTFQSGVLPKLPGDVDYSAFKPLVEAAIGTEGETPTAGLANRLTELQVAAGAAATDWVYLGSAPGVSGESISYLSKGGVAYPNLLAQISAGMALANAAGKSYAAWCLAWAQGETDYLNGTPQVSYKAKLIALKNDFAADSAAITGQRFTPPLITYQTAAHRRMGSGDHSIARAQWQASREDADIIMACPAYALEHASDKLHLTAEGSRQMGRYFANALHQSLSSGQKWRPLEPAQVLWQGKVIDITFNIPDGPMVFDTTLVAAAPNQGFDIWEFGAAETSLITAVSIVAGNRVRLTLSRAADADAVLTYARGRSGDPAEAGPLTGSRGNLRDSAGVSDHYTDGSGATRRMHNWCVMFSYQQNQGLI